MLGIQLSALHHATHDADSADCEICLYADQIAQLEWQPTTAQDVSTNFIPHLEQCDDDDYAFAKAESFSIYYPTRPPPVTS